MQMNSNIYLHLYYKNIFIYAKYQIETSVNILKVLKVNQLIETGGLIHKNELSNSTAV